MALQKNRGLFRRAALIVRLILIGSLSMGSAALVLRAESAPGAVVVPQMNASEARRRIDALRTEIARHDELYFKKAAPVISDGAYDELKRELAGLEREFPETAVGIEAPMGAGDDRARGFVSRRHRTRMLSLGKSYSERELRAFDARVSRQLALSEIDYVVEPKFDGLAISVTYEKGRLAGAVTRGNGLEGDDVTANVLTIRSLPRVLGASGFDAGGSRDAPDLIELRGEIYLTYKEFDRINRESENAGGMIFANPRNLAAGTLKQLNPAEVAKRHLAIVFYGVGACEPLQMRPDTQIALLRRIRAWGLPTVDDARQVRGADAMWEAVQAVGKDRVALAFPIDGAVVKVNEVALQDRLGANTEAPLWAMAYKFVPERVETKLRAITLQVSRAGVLTPVAELAPVKLSGSTVTRASLYNREEIARRDIRVGDFVYIEKAGEIIPAIAAVNRTRRTADVVPYVFPTACPECKTLLVFEAGEAAVRCSNWNCPAQIIRRVEHFAASGCVDIHGLGPALIAKLVRRKLVENVADLYRLRRGDLLAIDGIGEKSADRALAAIERSKHAELWRFINGLGIPRVGEKTARELARNFGSLDSLAQLRPGEPNRDDQLTKSAMGDAAADAIITYFARAETQRMIEGLRSAGVRPNANAESGKR